MIDNPRRSLGRRGEELAEIALQRAGFTIRERNWRCTYGEIDIVAEERAPDYGLGGILLTWLVFVEVRTKSSVHYGTPLQSITARKAAKLRQLSAFYVRENGWDGPWRIDVVAILFSCSDSPPEIEHVRHAVSG